MNNVHPTISDAILPFVSKQTQLQKMQLQQEIDAAENALAELAKVGLWVRFVGSHDRYMLNSAIDILTTRVAMLNFKLKELGHA